MGIGWWDAMGDRLTPPAKFHIMKTDICMNNKWYLMLKSVSNLALVCFIVKIFFVFLGELANHYSIDQEDIAINGN